MYVTDGETNASLSKGDRLEAMLPERAFELLAIRRDAIIEKGGVGRQEGRRHQARWRQEGGAGQEGRGQEDRAKRPPPRKPPPAPTEPGDD